MDINGKKISKQKHPNGPPCQWVQGEAGKVQQVKQRGGQACEQAQNG